MTGCGRIGYDPLSAANDASGLDDAQNDAGVNLPTALPCEVDRFVFSGLPLSNDMLAFYQSGQGDLSVIDNFHITDTKHELRHLELSMNEDTTISGVDHGVIYELPDFIGPILIPIPSGHIMMLSDLASTTMRRVEIDSEAVVQSDTVIGDFAFGLQSYAQSSSGRMVIGSAANSTLMVRRLDSNFQPMGQSVGLQGGSVTSSISADGANFIVSWSGVGACQVARIDINGSIIAGPIAVGSGLQCKFPLTKTLASGRIAYIVHDESAPDLRAYGGTIDATLGTATPAIALGGLVSIAPQLEVQGDVARIPMFSNGVVRIADLDASGGVTQIGAEFGNTVDFEMLRMEEIGGATILVRSEGGQLVVRKLCR
jgi:hypothetical protein